MLLIVITNSSSDPRLAPFLARDYVGAEYAMDGVSSWAQPPVALVSLIVTLDGSLQSGGHLLPAAWIGGLGGRCETVQAGPMHTSVDVKLTPLGFFALSGRSPRELAGAYLELAEPFGCAGRLLEARLRDASSWEQRFAELDHFLLRRARDPVTPHPMVAEAWSQLSWTSGTISINALAASLGYSRRHLTAVFREQTGLTPKAVARLLRFQRVCERLHADPARWADIAADGGYCDQAHLNRDFRELAGTSPSRYLSALPRRAAGQ
jgi:AraC-like DNA-binding protein